MKKKLLLVAACAFVSVALLSFQSTQKENTLTKSEKQEGWKLLFDGKTMNGWRVYQNKTATSWEVANGELHARGSVTDKTDKRSDIISIDQYDNFELSVDWKISKQGNSGIMYHVTEEFDAAYKSGPEYQIIDDIGFPEHLEEWQKTGADYAMHLTTSRPTKPVGEYNHTVIKVNGAHVEHWLNGVKIVEFEAWTPEWNALKAKGKWKDAPGYGLAKKGYIALQDHGSEVWFKNIKLRKL